MFKSIKHASFEGNTCFSLTPFLKMSFACPALYFYIRFDSVNLHQAELDLSYPISQQIRVC